MATEATSDRRHRDVAITAGGLTLTGVLTDPEAATGAILFAQAGRNDLTPRIDRVTGTLNDAGFATLAVDLAPDVGDDEEDASLFDIGLLADRLELATEWLRGVLGLPIGYLGAGTGASAALWAAADEGTSIGAVVSFGGWPDLATSHLALVKAPTLLVVGGVDGHVLELNRNAIDELPACEHELAVVAGATHLFEQTGALEQATGRAVAWFVRYLA